MILGKVTSNIPYQKNFTNICSFFYNSIRLYSKILTNVLSPHGLQTAPARAKAYHYTLHTSHSSDAATASCYNNMIQGEPKNNLGWENWGQPSWKKFELFSFKTNSYYVLVFRISLGKSQYCYSNDWKKWTRISINYLVTYHLKLTLNQCGINSGLKLYRYWVQFKKT